MLKVVNFQFVVGGEGFWNIVQCYVILWLFWFGEVCFDVVYIQCQGIGKDWFIVRLVLYVLGFSVGFYQCDLFFVMVVEMYIVECYVIDREKVIGGVIFWCYIGDGCFVGKG